MEKELIFRTFLYLIDGLTWFISYTAIMTGFFGYHAKSHKKRVPLFVFVLIVYDIVNLLIYYLCTIHGKTVGVLNGFVLLFIMIYWCIYLEEKNKFKILLLGIAAVQIFVGIMELVYAMFGTIFSQDYANIEIKRVFVFLQPMVGLGVTVFISWLSSRKRKDHMSNTLVLVSFLMFVLLDGILSFFGTEDIFDFQPIVKLRLLYQNEEKLDQVMGIGILVVMFMLMVTFLLMVIKESESGYFCKKNAVSEYYLEAQKEHYESLMQSNREIRKIKHDMKNHMYCLQKLCECEKYEELQQYITELTEHLAQVENMVYTGNEIADAIISEKMKKAKNSQIKLKVEGTLHGLELSALDTCTIFSNLIDNALEAVEKLDEENRIIQLDIRKNKNFFIISERNSIENDLEITDNTIQSTKNDRESHGFGIINIKEAVANYNGECRISLEINDDGNKNFVFEIMIPIC